MSKVTPLTQERLKELLYYDPDTGIFWWRVKRGRIRAGAVAGTINDRGYISVKLGYVDHRAHRLAWFYVAGEWPPEIDHVNLDRTDNRWSNLRLAEHWQNLGNIRGSGRSNLKGAFACGRRWRAAIKIDGRYIHLGVFATVKEAHNAYCRAAKVAFGEYARYR